MASEPITSEARWNAAFLQRLSSQLGNLAMEMLDIEQTLADIPVRHGEFSDTAIRRLQRIDYLRQSMDDLALLTDLVSRVEGTGTPDPTQIRGITRQLNLESTRRILQSAPRKEVPPSQSYLAGYVDLF